MYCSHCGQLVHETQKFCGNCGLLVAPAEKNIETKIIEQPPVNYAGKLSLRQLAFIISGIFIAIATIGIVLGFVDHAKAKIVVNFLLGITLAVDILVLMAGGLIGLVFLIRANNETGDKRTYYQRIAIWTLGGPIIVLVGCILAYIIMNVIFSFINPIV